MHFHHFQSSWDSFFEQQRLRAEKEAAQRLVPRQEKRWGWGFWAVVGILAAITGLLVIAWLVPSPELMEWASKWIPGY